MLRKMLSYVMLPLLLLLSNSSENSVAGSKQTSPQGQTGTLQKMIVVDGSVTMDLDLNRLNGITSVAGRPATLHFAAAANSFFPILVSNDLLRGPEPGSIALVPQGRAIPALPTALAASLKQIVVEKLPPDAAFDLAVRDGKTGFTFFNIEGHQYDYDAKAQLLSITGGRLLVSKEFAESLGRSSDVGAVVGEISIGATMQPVEITRLDENGDVKSATLPALNQPGVGTVPGPDVIIGELIGLVQSQTGSVGGRVGLALGTDACNKGTIDVDWFALPSNDHPFIPQNVYRMSGGADNTQRFEQIGQSWGKHAFTAASSNTCGYGCNGIGGSHLGSGCSDAYGAGLNGSQTGIGSRAWVNPFTGNFPGSTANNHSGHVHDVTSHRILVNVDDLNTSLNLGAAYFAEAQYVVPHEYTWCQSHPGQCNMYNNASYRRYSVTGINQPFTFSSAGPSVREQPAIMAWTGATINTIEPVPGVDGFGLLGFKVTNPSAGVWHYEYAIYNQNLDRGIQSFSLPLGCGITVNNLGFHAPLNPPGFANDGTLGDTGYSNAAWTSNQTCSALSWSSETFAQNQNANAIRFGTLYNFRFDSNSPPQATNATIGFFKTGAPITVAIQGPSPGICTPVQLTDAVSRKTHGAAGTFDVELPLTGSVGIECRSGGAGGNHTFVFTFTNNVVSGNATVTGTGFVSSFTFSGNTMTVNLTGVSDVQQITVTLSNVTDCFGSVLPDTMVSAAMLIGDTTGNRTVNSSDVAQVKGQVGVPVSTSNFREDATVNGSITASDVGLVKVNVGHSVP
jgi:hypothetical protein